MLWKEKIKIILTVGDYHQDGVEKVTLVQYMELLIPCMLYLENHVGERIINMMIRFGFKKHQQTSAA